MLKFYLTSNRQYFKYIFNKFGCSNSAYYNCYWLTANYSVILLYYWSCKRYTKIVNDIIEKQKSQVYILILFFFLSTYVLWIEIVRIVYKISPNIFSNCFSKIGLLRDNVKIFCNKTFFIRRFLSESSSEDSSEDISTSSVIYLGIFMSLTKNFKNLRMIAFTCFKNWNNQYYR